jgi:hypothetical protein
MKMKVQIEHERLLSLLNSESVLNLLEQGGVDNWTFYSDSLEKYEEITTLKDFGVVKELKYSKGDSVFYNNNSASFVCYLTEETCVIIVKAFPYFDNIDSSNHCEGCQIGDSDNKIPCSCEDIGYLIDDLEESTDPTYIPLIVNSSMLYDKPMVVSKHEDDLAKILEKRNKLIEQTKGLTMKNIELESKQKELEEKIKALEELKTMKDEH